MNLLQIESLRGGEKWKKWKQVRVRDLEGDGILDDDEVEGVVMAVVIEVERG